MRKRNGKQGLTEEWGERTSEGLLVKTMTKDEQSVIMKEIKFPGTKEIYVNKNRVKVAIPRAGWHYHSN